MPLATRLLVSLARRWPARRGRTQLRQLVVRSLAGRQPLIETRLARSELRILAPWADPLGSMVVTFGDTSPDVFRFLECSALTRRYGETLFVEVGANLGIFSLRVPEHFGIIDSIAYEANPAMAQLLRESIVRNRMIGRIEVREVALGDRDVSTWLQTAPGNSGISTVTDHPDAGEPVKMRRLASEFSLYDWEGIVALKVDVEGVELGVFQGAESLFAQHLPLLTYAVNRPALAARGLEPRALGDFLRRVGYQKLLALGPVLYPPENGLHEVCHIVAIPDGHEGVIAEYGFDAQFRPSPERGWPVCHFEI